MYSWYSGTARRDGVSKARCTIVPWRSGRRSSSRSYAMKPRKMFFDSSVRSTRRSSVLSPTSPSIRFAASATAGCAAWPRNKSTSTPTGKTPMLAQDPGRQREVIVLRERNRTVGGFVGDHLREAVVHRAVRVPCRALFGAGRRRARRLPQVMVQEPKDPVGELVVVGVVELLV